MIGVVIFSVAVGIYLYCK